MSISATRARSSLVENSLSWASSGACLISTSAPFLRAATLLSSGNGRGRLWVATVLGLTVFGFKLCSEALEFLKVCMMWIRVWRHIWKQGRMSDGRRNDHATSKFSSLERRRVKIDKALNTTTFREWKRGSCRTTRQTTHQEHHDDHEDSSNDPLSSANSTIIQPRIETSCVICLENFDDNDNISYTKKGCDKRSCCTHIFHAECLQVWLKKHTSCPMCRYCMLPDS